MKKLISVLLCAAMIFTACATAIAAGGLWTQTEAYSIAWYLGHEDDTRYLLSDAASLAGLSALANGSAQGVASAVSFEGKTIALAGDISLAGREWVPIAHSDEGVGFAGVFDGRGFEISNVTVGTDNSYDNTGFFGYLFGAEIKRLRLSVSLDAVGSYLGGLAGYVEHSVLTDCSLVGEVEGESYVGGLLGSCEYATVTDCSVDAEISAVKSYAGGIVGAGGYITISDCTVSGSASAGMNYAGGIAGYCDETKIYGCTVSAPVDSIGFVGGIVGRMNGGEVDFCTSLKAVGKGDYTGPVRVPYVGGIVGMANGIIVKNCRNLGAVDGGFETGGLAGQLFSSSLRNCYNRGDVVGYQYVGGAAGNLDVSSIVENCYSAAEVTGTNHVGGLVGTVDDATPDDPTDGSKIEYSYYLRTASVNSALTPVASGNTELCGVFNEAGALTGAEIVRGSASLLDALNAWVLLERDETLRTWKIVEGENDGYPIFGELLMLDWITVTLEVFGDGNAQIYVNGEKATLENNSVRVTKTDLISVRAQAQPGYDFASFIAKYENLTAEYLDDLFVRSFDKNVTIRASFTPLPEEYRITVVGGTVFGRTSVCLYAQSTVTVIADDRESFSCWALDREGVNVISHNAVFSFSLTGDMTLYAISAEQAQPKVTMLSASPSKAGIKYRVAYIGSVAVPEGVTVKSCGLIMVSSPPSNFEDYADDFVPERAFAGLSAIKNYSASKPNAAGQIKVTVTGIPKNLSIAARFYAVCEAADGTPSTYCSEIIYITIPAK